MSSMRGKPAVGSSTALASTAIETPRGAAAPRERGGHDCEPRRAGQADARDRDRSPGRCRESARCEASKPTWKRRNRDSSACASAVACAPRASRSSRSSGSRRPCSSARSVPRCTATTPSGPASQATTQRTALRDVERHGARSRGQLRGIEVATTAHAAAQLRPQTERGQHTQFEQRAQTRIGFARRDRADRAEHHRVELARVRAARSFRRQPVDQLGEVAGQREARGARAQRVEGVEQSRLFESSHRVRAARSMRTSSRLKRSSVPGKRRLLRLAPFAITVRRDVAGVRRCAMRSDSPKSTARSTNAWVSSVAKRRG